MAKVDRIVALMEKRIACGDYALRPLPTERHLASETGVSRMTARKALLALLDRGAIERADNGRLLLPRSTRRGRVTGRAAKPAVPKAAATDRSAIIAFAMPAHDSTQFARWRLAADAAAARAGLGLRIVHFHHWDDPILSETFETFQGVFLVPPAEAVPPAVADRVRNAKARIVALDADLTPHGIRSIDLVPPSSVQRLLDHLAGLGHRRIHCVNSQPVDPVIEQRIGQWHLWRAAQHIEGELLNEPDVSYGDPVRKAHDMLVRRLAAGPLGATALLCLTMPAALGVTRALYERGLVVGKDVSVCAANDEGIAAYLCPSLTATRMPDPTPYLAVGLEWMTGAAYGGPLLSRPADVALFVGESTGPAPNAESRPNPVRQGAMGTRP